MALLEQPQSAAWLRALDHAGLLTRIVPSWSRPAISISRSSIFSRCWRTHWKRWQRWIGCSVNCSLSIIRCQSPRSMNQLQRIMDKVQRTCNMRSFAMQSHPSCTIERVYGRVARALRADLQRGPVAGGAVPASPRCCTISPSHRRSRLKPGGGVSFHEHQTIGAQVAVTVARRLRLTEEETSYIGRVVREHMRPGNSAGWTR